MYVHSSDPFPTFGPVSLDPGSRYSTKLIKQYSVEFMTALLQLPSPFPLAASPNSLLIIFSLELQCNKRLTLHPPIKHCTYTLR